MATDRTEEIALRAYALWQEAGCPDGQDVQHWLQAESELDLPSAPAVEAPPAVAPKGKNSRSAKGAKDA